MYAIVETGGKQYRVQVGETLLVDRLPAEPGQMIALDRVLLLAANGEVVIGRPTVPGAQVMARVVAHEKGRKIIVFKYKPKVRYRRKKGYRHQYTRLRIEAITGPVPVEAPAETEVVTHGA